MEQRLQKLLAQANVSSRRGAEELIEQGRVRVNGQVAKIGDKADPDTDVVEVDGQRLKFDQPRLILALNKPKQVLSTTEPHKGDDRQTIFDLVPYEGHLFSIGRLDVDSEGLMVLTNDGDLAQKLTHPSFRHTKTYRVTVNERPDREALQRWESGVWLMEEDGGESVKTAPCIVRVVNSGPRETVLHVVMSEGRKRQIRRIAGSLGLRVLRLERTHLGQFSAPDLRAGEYRQLTAEEIELLQKSDPEFRGQTSRRRVVRRGDGESRDGDEQREPRAPRPPRNWFEEAPEREERPRRVAVRREGGYSDRPPRREGDARPPRREGGYSDRPPRREGDARPPRREGFSDRPPRREGDARPPRREGGYSDRPPRREGDARPPRREGYSDRPPRREGDARPPRREGGYSDRPPRREGDARPPRREGGFSDRPPRREGDARPPRREGGYSDRPPRREGDRPPRAGGNRPSGNRAGGAGSSRSFTRPARPARPSRPRQDDEE